MLETFLVPGDRVALPEPEGDGFTDRSATNYGITRHLVPRVGIEPTYELVPLVLTANVTTSKYGGEGGTCTHTTVTPRDFKSLVSSNSTTTPVM